jgi:hypothetical protein
LEQIIKLDGFIDEKAANVLSWIHLGIDFEKEIGFLVLHTNYSRNFWDKRGLILLLNHSRIIYNQIPEKSLSSKPSKVLKKTELFQCLNPIKICYVLHKENPEYLQYFLRAYLGKKIELGINPFSNPEFLGKLIENKLAVLNHSNTSDLQARYILPIKILLSNLLRFPEKLEKVQDVFHKTQSDFFKSFEIFELLCYLEQYNKITINVAQSIMVEKRIAFYKTLLQLKAFRLNNFDSAEITFNLENLSLLHNQYLALKDE